MNPEGVVEGFVVTILLAIFAVIIAELYYPNIGDHLTGLLPGFVEIVAYGFIIIFIFAIILEFVKEF